MKLIDILVDELPKRGGWPEGAAKSASYSHIPGVHFWDGDGFRVDCSDLTTRSLGCEKVTREQYEAALAAKNEGWIDWAGGECPVDTKTLVDIRLKVGFTYKSCHPGDYSWRHAGGGGDIIAYRLHKPQEVTKADDEADLNECIGHDVAPVWSGEGLPPVGCECEFMKHTLDAIPNWRRGIIKYVSEYTVVIVEVLSPGEFVAHPRTCDFRPVRTEAERKRGEAVKAITLTGWCQAAAEEIYGLIAAGKVPGVKLED